MSSMVIEKRLPSTIYVIPRKCSRVLIHGTGCIQMQKVCYTKYVIAVVYVQIQHRTILSLLVSYFLQCIYRKDQYCVCIGVHMLHIFPEVFSLP